MDALLLTYFRTCVLTAAIGLKYGRASDIATVMIHRQRINDQLAGHAISYLTAHHHSC